MKESLIPVGKITSAHGIKGEVKIQSFTASPRDIETYGPLFNAAGTRQFTISITGQVKKQFVARIEGVIDRNEAETLQNTILHIPRERLPAPEDSDELYLGDLISCTVELEDGTVFGEVKAYHNYGAGDLLEIALAESTKTEFFLFTEENFPNIDLDERVLVIQPPAIL